MRNESFYLVIGICGFMYGIISHSYSNLEYKGYERIQGCTGECYEEYVAENGTPAEIERKKKTRCTRPVSRQQRSSVALAPVFPFSFFSRDVASSNSAAVARPSVGLGAGRVVERMNCSVRRSLVRRSQVPVASPSRSPSPVS